MPMNNMNQRSQGRSRRAQGRNNQQQKAVQPLRKQTLNQPQNAFMTGIPRIRTLRGRNGANDSIIVSNTEIMLEVTGTIASGAVPAGGAIRVFRFENVATGNNMNTTRWLTKLATAYDKFKILSLKLRWVHSVPVTYAGQVAIRWDADPSKSAADASLLAVSGDMRAKACFVAEDMELVVIQDQLNRLPQYETFPNTNDTSTATVGSMNVAFSSVTPTAGVSGVVTLGYLWADYTVQLMNPSASINA